MSSTGHRGTYRDGLLTRSEAAASIGVTAATWSGYVSRGFAPAPTEVVGRTPLWDPDVVQQWHQSRPGTGRARKGDPGLPSWSQPTHRLTLTPEEATALHRLLGTRLAANDRQAQLLAGVRDRLGVLGYKG